MVCISQNKKGISMVETLAYVILYGSVMSLIATLVFVLMKTTRKVTAQSILNRGSTQVYNELLSQIIALNPDTVYEVVVSNNNKTVSIEFARRSEYDEDGVKFDLSIENQGSYAGKPYKIKYSYTEGHDNIDVTYTKFDATNPTTTGAINLEKGMTITSLTNSIADFIKVDYQNSTNSYVTFQGKLNYDKKTLDFNYVIPVFGELLEYE